MSVRHIGLIGAMIVLLLLMIISVHSGISYVAQYRVHSAIDQWQEKGTTPATDEWQALHDSVEEDGSNVDAVNALGRLYDFRSSSMSLNKNERNRFGQLAAEQYLKVTRLRPAWPYGWMNLALVKAQTGEIDEQFRHALLQLLKLGAWEHNTLPEIIRLSLFAWPYLSLEERKPLLDYYLVAQMQRKGDVHKALKGSDRLLVYCAIVNHAGSKASFCP
ncbi:MAG: hypothetical protein ACE5E3_04025 [Mariprofundus sp.]